VGDVEGLFCAISYNSITVIQVIASVYRSVYMSFSGQQEKDEQKKKEKSLSFLRRRKRRYDIGKAMLLFCKGTQTDATTQHTMLNPMNL